MFVILALGTVNSLWITLKYNNNESSSFVQIFVLSKLIDILLLQSSISCIKGLLASIVILHEDMNYMKILLAKYLY